MRHEFAVRVGPAAFRVGSAWRAPIAALERLYAGYPTPEHVDYTVRLEPAGPGRRWVRPSVAIAGDWMLPDAAPLPLAHALLAAEMGMNLQVALGHRRHLLLHASAVARDGGAVLMTGESGAGKSTLATMLGLAPQWRFMADEFALIDPATGAAWPFPRLVSLKNESVAVVAAQVGAERLGPLLRGTPKGDVRHLVPDRDAIARMDEPAMPRLLLFPRFGAHAAVRPVARGEAFVRLTQASTNYGALGEAGFVALTRLVETVPAYAVDYPDTDSALRQVEDLWRRG